MLKGLILQHQTGWQWHPGLGVVSGLKCLNTLAWPFEGHPLFVEEPFVTLQLLELSLECLLSGDWDAVRTTLIL